MKTILLLAVLALAGIYVFGAVRLSEAGALTYIGDLEMLAMNGEAGEYCDQLHEDMEVSIRDYSAEPAAAIDGGKDELCEYITRASKGMALLGVSMETRVDDVEVTRSWLHPWTADLSYSESRTTRIRAAKVTLKTESEDEWTLVQTFGGMKVKRLVSEVHLAE